MPKEAHPGGDRKWWEGYKGLALGVGVSLLFITGVAFFTRQGLGEISRMRQELQRLEWENARLAQENRRLALTIERLHHDPQLIQDQIRKHLNFLRKNELILHLPEDSPPVTRPAEPPKTAALRPEGKSRFRPTPQPASPVP